MTRAVGNLLLLISIAQMTFGEVSIKANCDSDNSLESDPKSLRNHVIAGMFFTIMPTRRIPKTQQKFLQIMNYAGKTTVW
jgi:hypothetical protein